METGISSSHSCHCGLHVYDATDATCTIFHSGWAINAVVNSASSICEGPEYIHRVQDSYVKMSIKEGERLQREDEATGIAIIDMSRDTPIPQQLY
ncbi:hypothetical protein DPMN_016420 [Dreissena polymorpha]|uniref:Uncharacterized protein n=1 Tax=Dreissena polymorpha TaxID=45954 RepID=A0A9D4S6F0_DREPO|nr:hypothetical protein DPMN_016420 [Dreissena polymorpha]